MVFDSLTRQPIFSNVQPDKPPPPEFEHVTDVTGPNGEALTYNKRDGSYRLAADPTVVVKVPTIAKKPPTPEADTARYLQLQTDQALGNPLTPASRAWAQAYRESEDADG